MVEELCARSDLWVGVWLWSLLMFSCGGWVGSRLARYVIRKGQKGNDDGKA